MKCLICESNSKFYFAKDYKGDVYGQFMEEIGPVEYYKCQECGFVFSSTHRELSTQEWQKLNSDFHNYGEDLHYNLKPTNSPPYAEQSLMLALAGQVGIIDTEDMLDYAGGRGTLSRLLLDIFGIKLPVYDPYVRSNVESFYIEDPFLKSWKVVFNSAMFEHVLCREDLDLVNGLVAEDGVLIVHTVVCEGIPKDPHWFYLTPPVHTAFHTNKSMGILMEQWGYKTSIYAPKGKSWFFLKEDISRVQPKVEAINSRLKTDWFLSKEGFLDYWK